MKKILFVGSEAMPFAATGGLGDVLGSLPAAIKARYGEDADVRVVMPLYDAVSEKWRAEMKTEAGKSLEKAVGEWQAKKPDMSAFGSAEEYAAAHHIPFIKK